MIRSGQVQDQEYSLLRKHSHWVIQMQLNSCIKKTNLDFLFYIGTLLIDNGVIVSGEQQRNSATHTCVSISPKPSYPSCHSTWAGFSELCSKSLLVVHFKSSGVCMSIPSSLTTSSPLPTPFPLGTRKFVLLSLWICFCFVNKFSSIIGF